MARITSLGRASNPFSALALILVNLIPLYGVLFLGWRTVVVLFLYWMESLPVGIFALLRIGLAAQPEGPGSQFTSKRSVLLFFPVHFGLFMLGHLVFLYAFFGPPGFALQEAVIVLSSFFVSHGMSFLTNYVARREFRVTTPGLEMARPYTRVLLMHATLILGGIASIALKDLRLAVVVLVLIKTGIDLSSHLVSHSRYKVDASAATGP